MLFTSYEFFIFFVLVFALYYLPVVGRWQVWLLVGASLIFYAWHTPVLLLLLLLSITINAVASARVAGDSSRRAYAWAFGAVAANLLILAFFKYGALVTHLFMSALALPDAPQGALALLVHLPLPIGISFYTFEGISLVVDVYKRRKQEEAGPLADPAEDTRLICHPSRAEHFLRTSLFVTFFPHLIAGPILKAAHFFPQIGRKYFRDIPWLRAVEALIIGYFLKAVVADNLKDFTFWLGYPFYQTLSPITGFALLFGYSMQIFADFAGYSLIAVGLGLLLGYDLPNNFNFPYVSRSLSEFWTRWHISLSMWLRNYLYIPLGGNRRGNARTYFNLMVVMALGGLWHGAALSYAVWGIYHGLGLAAERWVTQRAFFRRLSERPRGGVSAFCVNGLLTGYVFSFVTLGWLLFKLPTQLQAFDFLRSMVANRHGPMDTARIAAVLVFSLPVILYHLVHYPRPAAKPAAEPFFARRPVLLRQMTIGAALALIILNSGSSTDFIYFQF